ncbi:MAG TPA: glycosyltransferase family 39 protein, partial [Candidatus Binataceae bacterium]
MEDVSTAAVEPLDESPAGPAREQAALPHRWLVTLSSPRYAYPFLALFGCVLFLINLGGYPLYTKGEPREAITVFDILHGGGWILPMRAGVEIPSKPMMMQWLAAIASIIAGNVSEFTVRLPSAIFAIAGIMVCYLYARKLFGEIVALVAALILATSIQYGQAGDGARVDMTLTFFMEVAFFEFILFAEGLSGRRMLFYLAMAGAVLTKGPVGLILPVAAASIWIVVQRRWDLIAKLALVRGALLVAILAGAWYLAATYIGGFDFFRKQILAENLYRFFGGKGFHEGHEHTFLYVELALLIGFMPWTVLMPLVTAIAAWRPRKLDGRTVYL